MKKVTCPTCKGMTKISITTQKFTEGKFVPRDTLVIDCIKCKGKGEISEEKFLADLDEQKIWCTCENSGSTTYYGNGNKQKYIGGNTTFTINTHHHKCNSCKKIVQIG